MYRAVSTQKGMLNIKMHRLKKGVDLIYDIFYEVKNWSSELRRYSNLEIISENMPRIEIPKHQRYRAQTKELKSCL